MTYTSKEDFAREIEALEADVQPFQAFAAYDRDGDCIEFFARPDEFYGQRIDNVLTVYVSEQTGEVVGSLVKGVSRLLKSHPRLQIVVEDGRVRLDHILVASMATSHDNPPELPTIKYQKQLLRAARTTGVEANVGLAAAH